MKIVHLIFDLTTGGAETMLVDIINEQVKTEQVSIIIINNQINNELLEQIDKKVKVILIGRKEKSRNPIPIFKLNWYLFQINPDVIHCHHQAVIRIIVFKNRCVLTVHDVKIPTNNFRLYKKVFAISNTVKTDIEKRSKVKPILIYNGVKLEGILQKEDYSFKIFRIVMVSRLEHEKKGQHILLEALKIIVHGESVKNICVDFIGEGKSLSYLVKLVKEYQLEEYVNFLGIRNRKYIYEHLKDYNLLVQPSLYEGFGLTIVEAMTAKVPVLVSDIDGPLEVIGDGKYGWMFKSGDAYELQCKIKWINNNAPLLISMNNRAYDYCIKNFSLTQTSTKYLNNYKTF